MNKTPVLRPKKQRIEIVTNFPALKTLKTTPMDPGSRLELLTRHAVLLISALSDDAATRFSREFDALAIAAKVTKPYPADDTVAAMATVTLIGMEILRQLREGFDAAQQEGAAQ